MQPPDLKAARRPLDTAQAEARELLARVLRAQPGKAGAAGFAAVLADHTGRTVIQQQLSHWLTGLHPVPGWVEEALPGVVAHTRGGLSEMDRDLTDVDAALARRRAGGGNA